MACNRSPGDEVAEADGRPVGRDQKQAGHSLCQLAERAGLITAGTPVSVWQNPCGPLERACTKLGLPRCSPRALRRTPIIRLIEQGIDVHRVAHWQGHANAKPVLDTYGDYISPERTAAELKELENG